jgi:ankyrin repeat protein
MTDNGNTNELADFRQFYEDDDADADADAADAAEEQAEYEAIANELAEQARAEFPRRMRKLAASGGGKVRRRGNASATHVLDVPMEPSEITMMVAAAAVNDVDFMQALFDAGASVVLPGITADDENHPLLTAVVGDAFDAVEWLVDHGVPPDEAGDPLGEGTPLWHAIDQKNDDIAALLVTRGAALDASPTPHFNTLAFALSRALVVTSRLIAERAPHLIAESMSRHNEMFFSSCTLEGFLPLTRHILDNFQVDLSACSIGTSFHPLILTCNEGLLGHVELLLERGAPVNQPSKRGTALHVAANGGFTEVVKRLLAAGAVAEPDVRWHSYTPLLLAARAGNLEIVRMLVDAGADTGVRTVDGETVLHFATVSGNVDVVRFVLPFNNVDEPDRNGTTATLWACTNPSPEYDAMLDVLVEAGAKLDIVDREDWSPFTALAANGRFTALKMLVERHGYSVHFTTPGNTNLAYYAAEGGHFEMLRWLLGQGVECNIASTASTAEIGETPLYVAAEAGQLSALRLLVEAGANIHHKTQGGVTPLAIASRNGHGHVVRYLLRQGVKATRKELEESVVNSTQPGPAIAYIAFGYQFDEELLGKTAQGLPFYILYLAGVPVSDDTNLQSGVVWHARLCGAIRGRNCPFGEDCGIEDEDHYARFFHAGEEQRMAQTTAEFFNNLPRLGLSLINDRATDICIALQSLALPALITLSVVDAACPLAHVLPMHVKWRLVTLIKHFKDKKK